MTTRENKNWEMKSPTSFPADWEVVDLHFIPFSRIDESGWKASTYFGKDYEIRNSSDLEKPFQLVRGANSPISWIFSFSDFEEAVASAQSDFIKYILGAIRIKKS